MTNVFIAKNVQLNGPKFPKMAKMFHFFQTIAIKNQTEKMCKKFKTYKKS